MKFIRDSAPSKLRRRMAAAVAIATAGVIGLSGCSASPSAGGAEEVTTVKMALQPLHQYAAWEFAEQSGMAEELGLNLEFTWLPQVDTAVQSLARQDLNVVSTCTACNFPYLKQSPNLRDAMIISQFKGFILIGHSDAPSYQALVAGGAEPEAARKEVHSYLAGKTFVLRESAFGALLNGMLEFAGLTRDDIKVVDVADDARAAQAFLQGEADFYIGSLAQESKLLREYPNRVVNVGGAEIIGPGGLWYDTMAVDQRWLSNNEDTVVKLTALWARVARYVNEKPDAVVPTIMKSVNERSGSSFEDGEIEQILNDFIGFASLERWEADTFNPSSELYWRKSLNFYAAQNVKDGVLPADIDVNAHYVAEDYYKKLRENQELVDWIKAPLK
ncbi:ABC transporter substrate-binding protein [Arthrobacter sp. AB6]|uniref:ABC transporter substrate-binding protein n=1 Tax=Arthrobacter sp. AB6 TaxID=2962570 RepID=UPI002881B2A0|nr:ABC transporter substrate-binding protein [Arthrobacter sp. AB6]MDT0196475.1 ABC transporter substrate-binding protein [Arthrobacter sp. AB6]